MALGTRYVRAFRGSSWTDRLSLGSLGEGDVFALFEEDGTRVTGNGNNTFRATKAPSMKGGIWGIDAEPYKAPVPEIK